MVGSREWRRKDKVISWEVEDSRGGTRVHGGVRWYDKLSDFCASLRTSESKGFPFFLITQMESLGYQTEKIGVPTPKHY
jgi:hypothetical protein